MLIFKVKNNNVALFVFKDGETYSALSSDLEGHEGLLTEGLNTFQELEELVAKIFNSKITCCGIYRGTQQLARIFKCDEDLLV